MISNPNPNHHDKCHTQQQSKPEEQQMVDALKLAYAPFDFNETQEEEEGDEE